MKPFKMTVILSLLVVVLVGSVLVSVSIGSVNIPVGDVFGVIYGKIAHDDTLLKTFERGTEDIVFYIRLPRVLLALLVGVGLSISGVVMQAVVKNPLADPYILGISSGASLGATLALAAGIGTFFGPNFVGICAFIGAFCTALLVLTLAGIRGKTSGTRLILAGMALSTVSSSISSFVIYFSDDREGIRSIAYWLMGSVSGAKWDSLKILALLTVLVTVFFISQWRTLNLMLLGDEVSLTLGKELHHYRTLYLLVASLLVGFVVYSSGIIGFVGLIVPHCVRMLVGTDHKKVLPVATLAGGIFLVWADLASRVIVKGSDMPIGIVISMIGAPLFIYLMLRRSYHFGGA
ncbi:FecCD family ABC transporter permease [Fusibacter sp. JL298sf-3]